jgi:hypothetical protein
MVSNTNKVSSILTGSSFNVTNTVYHFLLPFPLAYGGRESGLRENDKEVDRK